MGELFGRLQTRTGGLFAQLNKSWKSGIISGIFSFFVRIMFHFISKCHCSKEILYRYE